MTVISKRDHQNFISFASMAYTTAITTSSLGIMLIYCSKEMVDSSIITSTKRELVIPVIAVSSMD